MIACKCDRCHEYFDPSLEGTINAITIKKVRIINNTSSNSDRKIFHLCMSCDTRLKFWLGNERDLFDEEDKTSKNCEYYEEEEKE